MASSSGKRKLKIANVLRRFTFSEWGGTETVVWNTSKQLIKEGFIPEILSTKALDKNKKENIENIVIKRFNYFYPYFPLNTTQKNALDKKGGNPISLPIFKYIKNNDFDIFHSHTMGHLGNSVYLASKITGKPYVVSLHGGYSDVPQSELKNIMSPVEKSFHYGKGINALIGRDRFMDKADGIICVGHNEYLKLKEKYKEKNIIYLPNGVDIEAFDEHKLDLDFRKKYDVSKTAKILVCVSRIDHQKNQMLLIDALNSNKDKNLHLFIVGPPTSPEYLLEIKNKIEKYSLEKSITIIEGLKPYSKDLLNIYKASDIFILPSRHEPFGIVILEAWAAGKPVIASRVGGIKKLVADNETGLLFESESLDSLNDKIRTLLADESTKEKLIRNAGRLVHKEYSWKTISNKLTDFYSEVIDFAKVKSSNK